MFRTSFCQYYKSFTQYPFFLIIANNDHNLIKSLLRISLTYLKLCIKSSNKLFCFIPKLIKYAVKNRETIQLQ